MNWVARVRHWWALRQARAAREQAFIDSYENVSDYQQIRALKDQHVAAFRAWRDGLDSRVSNSPPRARGVDWRARHRSDAAVRGERDAVTHVSFGGEPCTPHYIDWVVVPGANNQLTLVPRDMAGDPASQRR